MRVIRHRATLGSSLAILCFVFFGVVFLELGLALSQDPAPPTVSPTIEQAMKTSIADCEQGHGSCFPVAEFNGVVAWVTCRHITDEGPTTVDLPNGDSMPVVFCEHHPDLDIGIIWTRANPARPISPIPLGHDPLPGTEAILAGYPADTSLWLSKGLMGVHGRESDPGVVWCSVPIYYGCSGGPVIVDGQLVGVGMGIYVDQRRKFPISTISAIVAVDSFRDWLQERIARGPTVR
jgi:hypothetical protein